MEEATKTDEEGKQKMEREHERLRRNMEDHGNEEMKTDDQEEAQESDLEPGEKDGQDETVSLQKSMPKCWGDGSHRGGDKADKGHPRFSCGRG